MEDKNLNADKINILEIVNEGIHLCKENYKPLLQICFISFVIFLFNTLIAYLKTIIEPGTATTLYKLFTFIIFFPAAYLDMRLTVALWTFISKCYSDEKISAKEAFALSGRTIWAYVGTSLLYALMLIPMLIIFLPLFLMIQVAVLKWTLILSLAALTIYLGTVFGFAPVAAALHGAKESNFRFSKALVKGNLWRIMLLQLFIEVIGFSSLLISNLNPWFKASQVIVQYAAQVSYHFIFIFISPFTAAVSIVLYLTLKKKVDFYETGDLPDTMHI